MCRCAPDQTKALDYACNNYHKSVRTCILNYCLISKHSVLGFVNLGSHADTSDTNLIGLFIVHVLLVIVYVIP